ncbi:hypothetical protein [Brachybacterium sacelli]|uniref:hypothetical protein n=1 Tax=Brachybacterium sacelli TaxID=173364 RepID=UPI00361C1B8F
MGALPASWSAGQARGPDVQDGSSGGEASRGCAERPSASSTDHTVWTPRRPRHQQERAGEPVVNTPCHRRWERSHASRRPPRAAEGGPDRDPVHPPFIEMSGTVPRPRGPGATGRTQASSTSYPYALADIPRRATLR